MNGTIDDSVPKSSFERPPLAIRHLMMWTACAAIFLALFTAFRSTAEWTPGSSSSVMLALCSFSAGGGLLGLLLLRLRHVRTGPVSPGERLLLIIGLFCLALILGGVVRTLMMPWEQYSTLSWLGWILKGIVGILLLALAFFAVILGCGAFIGLLVAAFRVRPWRWRFFFVVAILTFYIVANLEEGFSGQIWVTIAVVITTLALGMAAWFDWRGPIRYPWTHWAGILCGGWILMAQLIVFAMRFSE